MVKIKGWLLRIGKNNLKKVIPDPDPGSTAFVKLID